MYVIGLLVLLAWVTRSSGTRVVVQCFGSPSYDWFFYFLFLFLLLCVSELVIHNGSALFLIFLPSFVSLAPFLS